MKRTRDESSGSGGSAVAAVAARSGAGAGSGSSDGTGEPPQSKVQRLDHMKSVADTSARLASGSTSADAVIRGLDFDDESGDVDMSDKHTFTVACSDGKCVDIAFRQLRWSVVMLAKARIMCNLSSAPPRVVINAKITSAVLKDVIDFIDGLDRGQEVVPWPAKYTPPWESGEGGGVGGGGGDGDNGGCESAPWSRAGDEDDAVQDIIVARDFAECTTEWCVRYFEERSRGSQSLERVCEIMAASNNLDIKPLLEQCVLFFGTRINAGAENGQVTGIRESLGIAPDIADAEELKLRQQLECIILGSRRLQDA